MTYGQHLRRSRHGILYFRFVIPLDVRPKIGRSELSVSLGTASKRQATAAALELAVAANRLVAEGRTGALVNEKEALKLIALHHVVTGRQKTVLQRELAEADAALAAKSAAYNLLQTRHIEVLSSPQQIVPAPGPTLSQAVEAFKAERKVTGSWTAKTAAMWESRLRLLAEWFGDAPLPDLSRAGMMDFLNGLKRLPRNASKISALKGLEMRALIEVPGAAVISPATVNLIMECMSAFFAWLDSDRAKWRISGNLAKGLRLSNVESVERIAFSAEDLRAMFSSPEWASRSFLHSYGYWLLPLGLLTGARINELCQVELKDFSEAHGHPVISLCTDGLRGKNKNARRTVPVHAELVRLGLLRHVERLRLRGESRLFPECSDKRDGHGQDASRWFGKFKVRAGIVDGRKVFHSARHGFVSQLLDAGVDEHTSVAPLVGHAGGGQSSRSYWNEKDMRRFVGIVNLVDHPVLTELVPVVEDVVFHVDVHRSLRRPPIRKPPAIARTAPRSTYKVSRKA